MRFNQGFKQLWLMVMAGFLWAGMAQANSLTGANIDQSDPKKMVYTLSNEILDVLNTHRAELEASDEAVKQFADAYVLPYVDTEKMARYATGRYWRTASKAQQDAFVAEFTQMLINSYSKSFLKLQISGVEVGEVTQERPGRVTVASVVTQSDGNKTDVVYRAFQDRSSSKWYLYDVAIEGISTLISYRTQYDSEIGKKGMDAVIADLKALNAR